MSGIVEIETRKPAEDRKRPAARDQAESRRETPPGGERSLGLRLGAIAVWMVD